MDIGGKVVLTQNIIITDGSNNAQLYVTNIESGLYLVTIKTNNAHYTGKLSIVK
jgi:alanine-alpha-ketoisovalerate/valine-pyruvate aminotransferase